MSRFARRTDIEHKTIRAGLQSIPGMRVVDLSRLGEGTPDLLVWHALSGRWALLEIKSKYGKLTPAEEVFAEWWGEEHYAVVFSLDEALVWFGLVDPCQGVEEVGA